MTPAPGVVSRETLAARLEAELRPEVSHFSGRFSCVDCFTGEDLLNEVLRIVRGEPA